MFPWGVINILALVVADLAAQIGAAEGAGDHVATIGGLAGVLIVREVLTYHRGRNDGTSQGEVIKLLREIRDSHVELSAGIQELLSAKQANDLKQAVKEAVRAQSAGA